MISLCMMSFQKSYKIQSEKYLSKKLFPVDKSNNYFSLFVGRILINEKNQLQMFFYLSFIIRYLMGCGDFFSKKIIFRIGVLPKNCVMKTKPPGRVKQQRIKRKTF